MRFEQRAPEGRVSPRAAARTDAYPGVLSRRLARAPGAFGTSAPPSACARPALSLSALLLTGALTSGCQTLAPQQTASTVEPGTWRLGGQISASPWCSTTLRPDPGSCEQFPRGFPLPVPELRLSGRTGLVPRADAGLSLYGTGVLQRGFRVGALGEAKLELWSASTPWGRQLLSLGAGIGAAREQSSVEGSRFVIPALDVLGPVFYGYQIRSWELVASARFLQRFTFLDVTGDGRAEVLGDAWLGFAVGAYTRAPTRWAFSLEYSAPTRLLQRGSFTASVGVLFDIGGRPQPERRRDGDRTSAGR
jgi:hypothetical protein